MDEIDREIVRAILYGPKTITELAKELFNLKDVHDLRKECSFLRYRLKMLIELGVLAYDRKSKRYDLIGDCDIGQSVVQLFGDDENGEVILKDSIEKGLTVFIYDSEGTLILFLDEVEHTNDVKDSSVTTLG